MALHLSSVGDLYLVADRTICELAFFILLILVGDFVCGS